MEQNNFNSSLQQPLNSGFNAASTSSEVIKGINLSGKTAIVTGGHTGIGFETTRALSSAGATVIVAARDIEKAKRNLHNFPNMELAELDLMDTHSIDLFTKKFLDTDRPLHLLINNAGIMWVPLRKDSRGIESQLATNYLGQFHLVANLWPVLKKANGARVINVSSFGHQMASFNFDDPNFNHREYQTLSGYGQSKTASNLFALELDNRAKAFNVRAYSVHPGSVNNTELAREAPMELFIQMGTHDVSGRLKPEVAAKLKTVEQGAATTVWCATSPMLNDIGGVCCENCDIAELDLGQIEHRFDEPWTLRGVRPYSVNGENAKRLWKLSEKMTGITFDIN